MAIQFVGSIGGASTLAASRVVDCVPLSGGIDTAILPDDCIVAVNAVATITNRQPTVDGFTEVFRLYANDTNDACLSFCYLRAGATPPATVTLTAAATASSNAQVWVIYVLRGVDWTQPLDVTAASATGINSSIPDPPSITPVTAGAVVVVAGVSAHNQTGDVTVSSGDLTNFVARSSGTAGQDASLGVGYVAWSSGAVNPAAFGFSGATVVADSWAAVSVAFRPAPSGGTSDAAGTAAGAANASGTAAAVAPAAGNGAAAASASGAAQALAASVGAAAGVASAAGVAAAIATASGSGAGVATAAGVAAGPGGVGASAGTSTAVGAGRAVVASAGAAASAALATGAALALVQASGAAASAASVAATGRGLAVAVGAAFGAGAALGVGAGGAQASGRRFASPAESRTGGRLAASLRGGRLAESRTGGRIGRW